MSRRGGALVETAMVTPILLALLIGTVQLGKIAYSYYMLEKLMFNLARYLGTQTGVNFCNGQDPQIQAAIDYALTGSTDSSQNPIIAGLTPNMFQVTAESQPGTACSCSASGCDASQGGLPPSFLVVSLSSGYPVEPIFWGFTVNSFTLNPTVRVPYEGN